MGYVESVAWPVTYGKSKTDSGNKPRSSGTHLNADWRRLYIQPTYKLRISYRFATTVLITSVYLLDTWAGINSIQAEMISQACASAIKWNKLSSLRPTTKQPHTLGGIILFHFQLSNLQARVWLGMAPYVAVTILLGTLFTDRFIRGIFASEQKIVPCHFHAEAILVCRRSSAAAISSISSFASCNDTTRKAVHKEFKAKLSYIARQCIIQPHTAAQVVVTTSALGLLLMKPHF